MFAQRGGALTSKYECARNSMHQCIMFELIFGRAACDIIVNRQKRANGKHLWEKLSLRLSGKEGW